MYPDQTATLIILSSMKNLVCSAFECIQQTKNADGI